MNGSGCKNCPVNPCETMNYRGSNCAAQRAKLGLGDPMTNADRIRGMSDEELAKFLPSICSYARKEQIEHNMCVKAECEKCLLEWFKQPAE